MRLTLDLVEPGPFRAGTEIRLRASYAAEAPVTAFHRIVMGWAPDELTLLIDGPSGRQVSERVMTATPKVLPVTASDFVRVAPDKPCSFDFPLWSEASLSAGDYTVRARRPAMPWLATAPAAPADLDASELLSNTVALRIVS